jgi:hypothetical protein
MASIAVLFACGGQTDKDALVRAPLRVEAVEAEVGVQLTLNDRGRQRQRMSRSAVVWIG